MRNAEEAISREIGDGDEGGALC